MKIPLKKSTIYLHFNYKNTMVGSDISSKNNTFDRIKNEIEFDLSPLKNLSITDDRRYDFDQYLNHKEELEYIEIIDDTVVTSLMKKLKNNEELTVKIIGDSTYVFKAMIIFGDSRIANLRRIENT
jgi:hypothetical protein